jgi:hypothetical protein
MPTLPDDLRNRLEKAVIAAREKAEDGARAALQRLYVEIADSKVIPAGFPETGRQLRVHLRAHARQLGDQVPEKGSQKIDRLVTECAYEFWHRMLFARFLAENNLLIHPESKVSISLEDCKEFGAEETPPSDGWTFASRCAARMLPQIFRPDDPLLQVPFAPEHKLALESILAGLPADVFTADDSLGWVYQFWQTKRKEKVNKSEVKIGGDELPAVTQLFTEHYMVLFLLHNTLGAWWVSKQATAGRKPADVELPGYRFEYLRFRDDGTPAARTFLNWPRQARDLRLLDPCCGSGHFLVAAFELLVRIRMHDEHLSARDACEAVLRDNLFGLELDTRCTQIAAFNLALAAWKSSQAGGYRTLPPIHIACSGQALKGKREDWLRLAGGDKRLRFGMDMLYDLFEKANDLGSLIDPRAVKAAPAMVGSFEELQPLLQEVLQREDIRKDAELAEAGVMAQGIARAAEILATKYHLVVTNVPYLGERKQAETLREHIRTKHSTATACLSAAFLERSLTFCLENAPIALVTPQSWLFQDGYTDFRRNLLEQATWNIIVRLGPGAFKKISGHVVNTALVILTNREPPQDSGFHYLDLTPEKTPEAKARGLREQPLILVPQEPQLRNPDHRIMAEAASSHELLGKFVIAPQGIKTGDDEKWLHYFWEVPTPGKGWEFCQSAVSATDPFGGRNLVVDWRTKGEGMVRPRKDNLARGKHGVAISQMTGLAASLYDGDHYDSNVAPIVPNDPRHLPALWAYCQSSDYVDAVRRIDRSLKVTNLVLTKVPFDLAHWQAIAEANGPLPEPHSNDPTQWLFNGNVASATAPHNLQVAIARLLGFRWPHQMADKLDAFAASNGIVCLPAIGADKTAAERLRKLLAAAYGADWSAAKEESLLAAAGFGGKTLYDWLRDGFFEQHCKLLQSLPFLWHIWDGWKDGFSAIVNYHKFSEPRLRDLIYHHLAEWIKRQAKAVEKGESGADARHAAALELQKKLKLIHEGEKPYDIFVRWKPLDQQPIGWEPDLHDGVRINIRPFIEADLLRKKPNIKWSKDKGRDPESAPWFHLFKGDRINDHHLSLEEKRKARGQGEPA